MVTDIMADEDILNLARVLRERDEGFIQITQATQNFMDDRKFLETLAGEAQRPILHNIVAALRSNPDFHRNSIKWLKDCNDKGLPIFGQAATVRSGFAFT